mgnify:FL=1
MKRLVPYLSPYKRQIALAVIFMIFDVFCEMVQPRLMANIVGKGIQEGNLSYIFQTGGLMVLLALTAIVAGFGNSRYSAEAGVGFAANLREGLFSKVQSFSFQNIDQFSSASLVTRLTNDVTQMQNICTMGMRIMIRAPLMLPFALFMAIRLNSRLALILAVTIPALLIALGLIIRKAMPLFDVMQRSIDRLNGNIQENLTNVRVVKSFVREEFEKEKFRESNDNLTNNALCAMGVVILNMPLMMLAMNLSIVAVVWFGGQQIIAGGLDVASMTAFINYIFQVLMSLMMLSMMFILLTRAAASYRRIRAVLDTEPDLHDGEGALEAGRLRGEVEFRNVSFRYSGANAEDVISGISFHARPGEITAIVGGTGSGKSTLVQLIPRLYDATGGEILIDGRSVRDYTMRSLRENIGMVLQKNTLFSGTIAENLLWGDENAPIEQVVAAAKNAQAHDFIMNFPKQYDTWIDQGGVNVSGGQKQRLCIARAMLKKPPILILDDSTSAVDTATERKIREALRENLGDTTIFLIAQRISSVQDADRILVLDDGRIVGDGTHDELLASCAEYREIYESQQEGRPQ